MKAENAIIIALIILILGAAAVAFIITESGYTFNKVESENLTTNITNMTPNETYDISTDDSSDYSSDSD